MPRASENDETAIRGAVTAKPVEVTTSEMIKNKVSAHPMVEVEEIAIALQAKRRGAKARARGRGRTRRTAPGLGRHRSGIDDAATAWCVMVLGSATSHLRRIPVLAAIARIPHRVALARARDAAKGKRVELIPVSMSAARMVSLAQGVDVNSKSATADVASVGGSAALISA
jgi:hypothetical protein